MPQPRVALALTIVSVVLVVLPAAATCSASTTPFVVVRASDGGTPFQGDSSTLVTVSPNGDHFRDAVTIRYWLRGAAAVRLDWARHGAAGRQLQADLGRTLAGDHVYQWVPPARPAPASYVLRLWTSRATATVVVHVQGIDVGAARAAYHPGDTARLSVRTDARHLTVDVLGITGAAPTTRRNDKVQGTPAGPAFRVGWAGRSDRAHALNVPLGRWSSGVYFVRVSEPTTDASASRRSCCGRASSAPRGSQSSCRRTRGRPTTSTTAMATAAATPGTPVGGSHQYAHRPSVSRAAVCRRTSTPTTCRSCAGSARHRLRGRLSVRRGSRVDRLGRYARTPVRPDCLPGAPRVRHATTSTTSFSATATSAGTSSCSRPTTSSGRSFGAGRCSSA